MRPIVFVVDALDGPDGAVLVLGFQPIDGQRRSRRRTRVMGVPCFLRVLDMKDLHDSCIAFFFFALHRCTMCEGQGPGFLKIRIG